MDLIKIGCLAAPELRAKANSAAADLGINLSEYLRMALIHLAEDRTNPFEKRSGVRTGRPPVHLDR